MPAMTCLLVALSLHLSAMERPAAQAGDAMFPDVPKSHWAYEAVAALHRDGILLGYPGGGFNTPASAKSKSKPAAVETDAFRTLSPASWLYQDTRFLEQRRLFIFPPPYFPTRSQSFTRYEVAIAVKRSLDALRLSGKTRDAQRQYTPDVMMRLKRLVAELSDELKALGASPEKMQRLLNATGKAPQ